MLRIRLQRRGKRNYATYRVVVADRHAPIKGRFVADVGHYNPHTNAFVVDGDKVVDWISKGAQPTATVHNLLVDNKVIKGEKVTSWSPKKKTSEDATEEKDAPKKDAEDTEKKEEGVKEEKKEEKKDEEPKEEKKEE